MKHMSKLGIALVAMTGLWAGSTLGAGSAAAQGVVNWNSLKLDGEANPRPWCGQWWGYRCNGVAINNKNNRVATQTCGYADSVSPAEKLDNAVGRAAGIEYAKLDSWLKCSLAAWADCQSKSGQDRSKCLQDATKRNNYRACASKPENKYTVDTAYEWEVTNKGQGAFGWDTWWGQCNAWGAAAVLYAEPVKAVAPAQQTPAVFGADWKPQTWTVADVKGLLTSALNDVDLAADGWFGGRYNGPESSQDAFNDVLPTDLLSAFSKHIGIDRHGVVIDRHTDWEVWNQPLWKYAVTNCRDGQDAALCGAGVAKKTCDVSFTWAEDGVGHGEVCVPPPGSDKSNHHYTERSLTFSVCVKDGAVLTARANQRWEVPETVAKSERWPDFIWVPGNLATAPNSGNPFVHKHFDKLVELAKLSAGVVNAPPSGNPAATKSYPLNVGKAIPDNDAKGLVQSITVTDNFTVKAVALCVDIDHSYRGDLVVRLQGPDGRTVESIWNQAGGADDNIKDCHDATNPKFVNRSSKGVWRIQVADIASADLGKWNTATLKLIQ